MTSPPPSSPAATTPRPVRVEGTCDPAFHAVEAAFRENFVARDEIGAALCIRVGGRVVVDLWGGHRDIEGRQPWARDTLVNAYSVGKGLSAMLVLALVERGELDLDAPVEGLWPEYAARGKGDTTLRMLLAHRGGLPGVPETLPDDAIYDWTTMSGALAAAEPYWPPGQAHGYHVNTFGFLVGEPVRRAIGLDFARAFRDYVAEPHAADFYIGLPDALHGRVAPIAEGERSARQALDADARRELARQFFDARDDAQAEMLGAVYFNPAGLSGFGTVNHPAWRRASVPSTNGHGTARAVARLYDVFLRKDPDRGGFVGPGLRAEATAIASNGPDRVLGRPSRFGLGLQLSQPTRRVGVSDSGYGHFGYGGTLGFADPESEVTFGYLMNRPGQRWQTPRTNALVDALREAMGAT